MTTSTARTMVQPSMRGATARTMVHPSNFYWHCYCCHLVDLLRMHLTTCYSQQDLEGANKTLQPMPRTTSQSSLCDHEKGVACNLCIKHGPGDPCGGYCERTVANSWRKLSQYERPWCGACANQLERDMTNSSRAARASSSA